MTRPRPGRRPTRLLALALAVAGGSLAAGCGVPTQDAARVIARNQVPPGLTTKHVPTTIATSPQQGNAYVYLVAGSRLEAVSRKLTGPLSVTAAILSLLKGPTTFERATGITTDIDKGVQLLGTHPTQTTKTKTRVTVTVDLNTTFELFASGLAEKLAVAQVVYTVDDAIATKRPATVRFEIEKQPIPVPVTSGALTDQGVNVTNYQTVAPSKTS